MRHPAYHLRPNKAVDRLVFIEAVRRMGRVGDLQDFSYYGFGGPYLEDFRLLYEHCPELRLVSIESDGQTFQRQEFHRPCGKLELTRSDFGLFLASFDASDARSIFWLDYTGLEYSNFEDLMVLWSKLPDLSMVKVTLRCHPQDFIDREEEEPGGRAEDFRRRFGGVMPDASADPPRSIGELAELLQGMIKVAAERTFPPGGPLMFQPVTSFYYSDGTGMFTLTGVICRRGDEGSTRGAFLDLPFKNLFWGKPRKIDVPVLSTKERLHLEAFLPCDRYAGRTLRKALGYLIDKNPSRTEAKLQSYSNYHRYYPYFMKAVP